MKARVPEIGDECIIQKSFAGNALGGYTKPIVKITAKRAYIDHDHYFVLADPERTVLPKYLDYTTKVVSIRPPGQGSEDDS